MIDKINEEKDALRVLMEEPENIHELALAKWKKIKSSKFIKQIIIEKIRLKEEFENAQPIEQMWSDNLNFETKVLSSNILKKWYYYYGLYGQKK